jgi:hypothetical protein
MAFVEKIMAPENEIRKPFNKPLFTVKYKSRPKGG